MRILQMTLENFKGIKYLDLDLQGRSASINGENATGKSTIADAASWLFTGKNNKGEAVFGIKTHDENGVDYPNLEHGVFMRIDHNGHIFSIKKVLTENWVTKKGSDKPKLDGNPISYYINEVPKLEKEFKAFLSTIAPEELFRQLSNPFEFIKNIDWTIRRKSLLKIWGDPSDRDIISSDEKLSSLLPYIENISIEDFKRKTLAEKKKLKEEKDKIPDRIDEATKAMPFIEGIDLDDLNKNIETSKQVQRHYSEELIALTNGNQAANISRDIAELNVKIAEHKSLQMQQANAIEKEKRQEAKAKLDAVDGINASIRQIEHVINRNRDHIAINNQTLKDLKMEYKRISAEVFEDAGYCPTCKQPMPEYLMESTIEQFNVDKSKKLSSISSKAEKIKDDTEFNEAAIFKANESIDIIKKELAKAQAELDAYTESMAAPTAAIS